MKSDIKQYNLKHNGNEKLKDFIKNKYNNEELLSEIYKNIKSNIFSNNDNNSSNNNSNTNNNLKSINNSNIPINYQNNSKNISNAKQSNKNNKKIIIKVQAINSNNLHMPENINQNRKIKNQATINTSKFSKKEESETTTRGSDPVSSVSLCSRLTARPASHLGEPPREMSTRNV
ncbi:hypothetical protein H8356DRAFT_1406240 [Neocallimastix lanati (nom. inval.)]|nr:hypothetical protein H8356DRAFT_1406240 [Neocallimastix sp. JGI-2020a]